MKDIGFPKTTWRRCVEKEIEEEGDLGRDLVHGPKLCPVEGICCTAIAYILSDLDLFKNKLKQQLLMMAPYSVAE